MSKSLKEGGFEPLLNPRSIAVVGASRREGKVGHAVLKNVVEGGFKGAIYPVNPQADSVLGLKCYPRVTDIGKPVDMAVIVVPAERVLEVAEDCGSAGVKVLVVISAGFKETGVEGARRESELISIAKKYRMRVLGPNCLGYINTSIGLNASFAHLMPLKGHISLVSQSGALLTALIDRAPIDGLAFSKIISLGNKADLDEIDYMRALAEDPETKVIVLYLEGINKGEEFIRVSREVSVKKPIVALKSGVTEAGARAASSHTGSMAGSEVAYNTAFRQFGVIRAESLDDLFDSATCFATQPIPKHRSVVIVTNAGGPGILAADACGRLGLRLAELGAEITRRLREVLPPAASIHNPIDLIGDAKADRYEAALKILSSREDLDAFVVILTPQAMTEAEEVAKLLVDFKSKNPSKTVVASFMGGVRLAKAISILREGGVPNYETPERAVKALSSLIRYEEVKEEQLKRLREGYPRYPIDRDLIREILDRAKRDERKFLMPDEVCEILRACGIRTAPTILARSDEEAVEAAEAIGYPVVLKVASPHITHKSDVGGVKIGLLTPAEVKLAYHEIMASVARFMPGAAVYGVVVSSMAPQGKEVIVGMHRDPQFGPLIMFGLGGVYVELVRDVSFRLAPLTRSEAVEMIMETKAYRLLKGFRGEPPSDIEAVVETLLKISMLSMEFREIQEIDINPLFVYEKFKGCLVVDAKIWW
ncbi:MAG: CoA-binding protein [Thermoprotei archaeon]|nr:MAG: CoA-binding protein [Thermoprotei archaeon]